MYNKILKSLVSEKIEFEVEIIGTLSTGHSEPVCSDIHCECTCIRQIFQTRFPRKRSIERNDFIFHFFFSNSSLPALLRALQIDII